MITESYASFTTTLKFYVISKKSTYESKDLVECTTSKKFTIRKKSSLLYRLQAKVRRLEADYAQLLGGGNDNHIDNLNFG
jgi:hypothetical protein